MAKLRVVKLLGPAPGIPVAVTPVGILAWDGEGNLFEDWVPDDGATTFWRGVVSACREAGTLKPGIEQAWAENIANGQTADLDVSDVDVPEGWTPREVFAGLADDLTTDWAMLTTEIEDAADGQPSLMDLFRQDG